MLKNVFLWKKNWKT